MLAKINLTLEQDEQRGTNAAMEDTIKLLATLEGMPITKLVLTLECEEMIAGSYRGKLHSALRKRPIGIIAKIKTTSEEHINVEYVRKPTPMDGILGFAGRHGATVEFGIGGETIASVEPGALFEED